MELGSVTLGAVLDIGSNAPASRRRVLGNAHGGLTEARALERLTGPRCGGNKTGVLSWYSSNHSDFMPCFSPCVIQGVHFDVTNEPGTNDDLHGPL